MTSEFEVRQAIVSAALDDLFIPYRWAGNGPSDRGIHPVQLSDGRVRWVPWPVLAAPYVGGFDCSGGVLRWQRAGGAVLDDHTAAHMFDRSPVISKQQVQPGDLCFYGSSRATHVAMALTDQATAVIGANGGGAPRLKESFDEYAARMSRRNAMVRIEDHRVGGYDYRPHFLGFRRAPLPIL